MENPGFLREKYGLHNAPEVVAATKRTEKRIGKKLPTGTAEDAEIRIENYLDRLKNVIHPPELKGHADFDRQRRNLEMLKRSLHERFVIKPEDIPEAYFASVQKRHEEEGRPLDAIPDEIRKELSETIIVDQQNSLDQWVDYLSSGDAKYPDYLKYFAFRSILRMGRYDKKKKSFSERTGGAIAPFPDLNREALAIVLESFERQARGEPLKFGYDIEEGTKQRFFQFLKQKNFAKLYALAVEEFKPIPEELLSVTEGKWVKYPKGSDATRLVQSIAPYGTGWCLRGESMAQRYLKENDLEIFYSLDKEGKPTVPRVVMVSENGIISEVRGVAEDEHLDSHINSVVQEKLAGLPDGKRYEKKARDMTLLTAIKNKTEAGEALTKDDLVFLYEINAPIESFGYGTNDPRVKKVRAERNSEEDMPIVFECDKGQIARSLADIKGNTKAYIGPLASGIFSAIQKHDIEHIYTSFPEGRIGRRTIKGGTLSEEELKRQIEQANHEKKINISQWALSMLEGNDIEGKKFATLEQPEDIVLVRLSVKDLGFPYGATTQEIYDKAEFLGLELCPAETGPQYRLQYTHQPMGEYLCIAMNQIFDSDGHPSVFSLGRPAVDPWLHAYIVRPDSRWLPDSSLVFRLRKNVES